MHLVTKQIALVLAKIAPFVGAFAFVAAIESTPALESPWTTLWRIGLTAAIAVFISLAGAIYHNLTARVGILEKSTREDLVPRRELALQLESIKEALNRIENRPRR